MADETMVVDAGAQSDAPVETQDVQTDGQQEATDQQAQQVEGQESPKVSTDPVKDGFAKLKEVSPKLESTLRKEFFTARQKAQDLQEQIDVLGGEEGIANMQQELQEYAEVLTQVAEGNPEAIERVLEDSKEGYLKLTEAALDKLPSVDPVRYEQTLIPHLAKYLADKGITGSTAYALQMLKDNRPIDAQRILEDLTAWHNKLGELGQQARQRPQDDPEKQRNQQEREAIENEKNAIYLGKINVAVASSIDKEIGKHLTPLLKGKSLTQVQKQGIVSDAYKEIAKTIHAQARTQQQLQAFRRSGKSPEEIARFLMSKITMRDADNQTLASRAIKNAWESRGFGAAPHGNGQKAQEIVVKGKPNADQIDWSKDENRSRYMAGEATLKNGRIVKWDWTRL